MKVFQYILKSIETFLIQNYFHSNFKTIQIRQKKKPGTNFAVTTDS